MKMNKIAFVALAALCAFTFFSCGLLTTPIVPKALLKYAPTADDLGNVSTTDLADAAGDISIAADTNASISLIEALGGKDQEEVEKLSPSQKKDVLALTTSAVLPVNTLVSTAYKIMNSEF